MKKKLLFILIIGFIFLTGYTFPQYSPYVNVNCVLGNNIKIYFGKDVIEYLEIEGNNIINTRSSTIYGYTNNYRISFPVYEQPYYNPNYNNVSLDITNINEVNFNLTATDHLKKDPGFYIFMMCGGILLWLIFKH